MVSFFLSTFVFAYFICGVDGFIFVRVLNFLLLGYFLLRYMPRYPHIPISCSIILLDGFFFLFYVCYCWVTFYYVTCLGYLNGVGCIVKHVAIWNGGH